MKWLTSLLCVLLLPVVATAQYRDSSDVAAGYADSDYWSGAALSEGVAAAITEPDTTTIRFATPWETTSALVGIPSADDTDTLITTTEGVDFWWTHFEQATPTAPTYDAYKLQLRGESEPMPAVVGQSRRGAIRFPIKGHLDSDMRIIAAKLVFVTHFTYSSLDSLFAVVDTNSTHNWSDSPATADNPSFCNTTWNNVNQTAGTPWPIALASLDDFHDYGIKSAPHIGSASTDDEIIIDVTWAIQAIAEYDLGFEGFWLFGDGTTGGFDPMRLGPLANATVQPTLYITYETGGSGYTGNWAGYESLFSFQSPDMDDEALNWAENCFEPLGYKMSSGMIGVLMTDTPADSSLSHTMTNLQNTMLYSGGTAGGITLEGGHDLYPHTFYNPDGGLQAYSATGVADPDSLPKDIDRAWVATAIGAAESEIKAHNYSWGGYHYDAQKAMVAEGIIGATRSGGTAPLNTDPAYNYQDGGGDPSTDLGWNGKHNIYDANGIAIDDLVGDGADQTVTKAEIKEMIEDRILSKAQYGGGYAFITGAHTSKTRSGASAGVDAEELLWALEILRDSKLIGIKTLAEAFRIYRQGHVPVDAPAGSVGAGIPILAADELWFSPTPPDTDQPTITVATAECINGSKQYLLVETDEECVMRWRSGVGAFWNDWSAWSCNYVQAWSFFDYIPGQPSKTYNFEVEAKDAADNAATNNGTGDSFTWAIDGTCP